MGRWSLFLYFSFPFLFFFSFIQSFHSLSEIQPCHWKTLQSSRIAQFWNVSHWSNCLIFSHDMWQIDVIQFKQRRLFWGKVISNARKINKVWSRCVCSCCTLFSTRITNKVNAECREKQCFHLTNWMMSSFRALLIYRAFVCFHTLGLYPRYFLCSEDGNLNWTQSSDLTFNILCTKRDLLSPTPLWNLPSCDLSPSS